MSHRPSLRKLTAATMAVLALAFCGKPSAAATQVWLAPDNDTADLLDLFRRPELWQRARSQISMLKLGPQQVGGPNPSGMNSLTDLTKVDAFRLLHTWGIGLAIEVPTDCNIAGMVSRTLGLVAHARAAGAVVTSVSMTGLLVSRSGACKEDPVAAAAHTAEFMREIRRNAPGLEVGDIEPYPSQRPAQIEQWLTELARLDALPAYLHLDANVHFLDVRPDIDVAADLRALKVILRNQAIPYGIIFWSGYDPEPTDQAFFERTMSWVRRVHAAIGAPDHAVFQSWITRSYAGCLDTDGNCARPKLKCPPDAAGCGMKSIPANLPEDAPDAFSMTRLVNEALAELSK